MLPRWASAWSALRAPTAPWLALTHAAALSTPSFINTLLYLHHGGQLDEEEQLRSASFLTRPEYYLFGAWGGA